MIVARSAILARVSQANLEMVRRTFDEVKIDEKPDEALLRSICDPDVEFLPRRAATEGAYRGIEGIKSFIADTNEVFDKYELEYEMLDLGQRVVAWGKVHARARRSGIETDVPFGFVYEFRDGKIVRGEDFGSKDKALEASAP